MTGITKCNYASSYILMFGKSFHIYKPIYIDLKTRIRNVKSLILLSNIIKSLMLLIFFVFRLGFFKKEKKGWLYIDAFLHRFVVQNKPLNKMILMLKPKKMFLKCFYGNMIKIFS